MCSARKAPQRTGDLDYSEGLPVIGLIWGFWAVSTVPFSFMFGFSPPTSQLLLVTPTVQWSLIPHRALGGSKGTWKESVPCPTHPSPLRPKQSWQHLVHRLGPGWAGRDLQPVSGGHSTHQNHSRGHQVRRSSPEQPEGDSAWTELRSLN